MDEFGCIDRFFNSIKHNRTDVLLGIGDDAACLDVPVDQHLLVSCDTLVAGVHFLETWDPYDIAFKAVMVNISDIAAMGGDPCWITLSLTLPDLNPDWLSRFSSGLSTALQKYNIALIGGDTTRGSLSIGITIHGITEKNHAIKRSGAQAGDLVYVSGPLGAAALALEYVEHCINTHDHAVFMQHLHRPIPRVDLKYLLRDYASSAIDISDGLLSDLQHVCTASGVGASLLLDNVPIHTLVRKYSPDNADNLALHGGDDYELCLTIPAVLNSSWLEAIARAGLKAYHIGWIDDLQGLRAINADGQQSELKARGYNHFGVDGYVNELA